MPRVAEGLLATDLDSLALSIYDDASEEGLPRDADSAKVFPQILDAKLKAIHWVPHPLWPEYGGRSVKPGCSGVEPQATFHDDLLIRYCRGGTGIACREFSTIIMDYVNHPSPWSCSSHKLDHSESSPEVQSNSAVTNGLAPGRNKISPRDSTSFFKPSSRSGGAGGYDTGKDNPNSSENSVRVSKQQNLLDGDLDSSSCSHSDASGESEPAYNRRTAHIKSSSPASYTGHPTPNLGYQAVPPPSKPQPQPEYGVYVSDAMMRLLKSTLCIRETEPKCPIYIYSIKPPYYSGQEKRHYYKIGRPLNIRHNNREKLKRCPMMQTFQSHQYRANLALLKRTSPTCGKLFMTLLRCELTINNFTALSRDENMCLICYGSHDEWFSISEEAAYQLQIAHKLPGNDLHWGWPYLHALVNKLILLID